MESKSFKDTLLRGIALLGLILILVLGAWGVVVLAFNVPHILSSAGATIAGIFDFEGSENEEEAEDEETVEVPVVSPTTPAKPATPAQPKPTYTYTPAAQPVAQLWGYADLAVRIISVVPQGGRYSMQFEVSNVGTNIASGWSFDAELPLDPEYTYRSGAQQALRPGDKIVYTLGFNAPYTGYDYDDHYNDDERYDDCNENYDRWDEDEWQDWYEDVFDRSVGSRDDWDSNDWEEWYDDFCDDRDDDRDYNNRDGVVRVTANSYGNIYELNRANNSASQRVYFNYNYYPTYPSYPYYQQYPWIY